MKQIYRTAQLGTRAVGHWLSLLRIRRLGNRILRQGMPACNSAAYQRLLRLNRMAGPHILQIMRDKPCA